MDRNIVQPIMPREIDLKEPRWFAVTEQNLDAFIESIKDQEGELIFLAMSVPDYEVMSGNMQELKRYITEMKDVVVYYRKVTMPPSEVKKLNKEESKRPTVGIFPRDKTDKTKE